MEKETRKELHTYKAVIHHDPGEDYCRLEWLSGKPKTNMPIEVEINVWEEPWGNRRVGKDKENGEKLARLLGMLAEKGTFDHIEDPVAWQREIRKDRPLPGRD